MPKGIPGVMPRLTPREHAEIRGEIDADGNPTMPERGPDGKFLPKNGADAAPEANLEAGAAPEAKPEKFKLADDLEFDSAEAAAKAYKKLLRDRQLAAGDQSKLAKELSAIRTEMEALRAAAAKTQFQGQSAADDAALGIDPEAVQQQRDYMEALEYIETLTDPKERAAARATLNFNMQQAMDARVQKLLDKVMADKFGYITEANDHLQMSTQADAAFDVVASLRSNPQDPESAPLFPELHEEAPTAKIAGAWDKMRKAGIPSNILHSPAFISLLVMGWRGSQMGRPTTQAGPAKVPTPPTPPIPPRPTAPAVATSVGFPSSSTPKAPPANNPLFSHPGMRIPGVIPRL